MTRTELLATIEEATDAALSDLAARDPEEAAADLEYMAREEDVYAERANTLTTQDKYREHKNRAEHLRDLAAALRKMVTIHEAA
jgi:hypothetical protein